MFAKVRLTMSSDIIAPKDLLPEGYANWKKEIITMIEHSKLKAIFSVNAEMLNLYWNIGKDILTSGEMHEYYDPETGEYLEEMDDETFEKWLSYHFATCERQDLIGATNHALDILRKE